MGVSNGTGGMEQVEWNTSIIHDSFAGSGTSVGPVVLGGVRLPLVVVGSNKKVNSAGNSMERWAAKRCTSAKVPGRLRRRFHTASSKRSSKTRMEEIEELAGSGI